MTTTLTAIGDKLGLLLDRPTLEKLGIDERTRLVVTADADGLHIRPVLFASSEEVETAAREVMASHSETLTRLAQ
jgi:antitoxin MazE